eukprot:g77803.t1
MAEDDLGDDEPLFQQVQLTVVVLSLLSAAACVLVLSLAACQCAKIQRSAYLQLSVNLVVAAGIQAISWAWGVSTEQCLTPGFLKLLSGPRPCLAPGFPKLLSGPCPGIPQALVGTSPLVSPSSCRDLAPGFPKLLSGPRPSFLKLLSGPDPGIPQALVGTSPLVSSSSCRDLAPGFLKLLSGPRPGLPQALVGTSPLVSPSSCRDLAPGFLKLLSGVASLMFICCLSVAIYWIMFFPDIKFIQSEFQHAVSRRITVLCWCTALAVALTVLGLQAFGPEDYWCWIDEGDLIVRVLLFDVIMALGLSVIVFVFVSLRMYGARLASPSAYRGDQDLAVIARDLSAKIMQKAMTYFLCQVWGLLDDIMDYSQPAYAYYTEIPSAFITPLYGLIISLLFLLDFPSLIGRDTSPKTPQVKTHSVSAASTPPYNCKATPESNLATGADTSRNNNTSRGNDLNAAYIGNESDPGQAEVDSVHGDAYDDFDSKIEIEFVMEAHQDDDLVLPDSEEMRKALQSSLRGSTSLERKMEPADLEEPDDHAPRNSDVNMESGVLNQGSPSPAAAVPRTSTSTPGVSAAVPRTSTSTPRVSAAVPRTSTSTPPRPRSSASTAPRVSASTLLFNMKQASTSVEHGPPLDKPQSFSSLAAALRGSSGRSKRFDIAENSHLPTLQSFDTSENSHLPT